ncbi:hypothetical protein [Maribacter luteus]|uniref:O-antigen ligase domain-containing protein n=1 Tax=Maribacter luteus TaxID=2594478 RepID=A0A6I2MJL9_9FLAO|nr:hypothetical protein [Maribacter luteus]MRX63332.1 hypothetical protein [Maribacter luteus]
MSKSTKHILLSMMVVITLYSVNAFSTMPINSTVVWWALLGGVLVFFVKEKKQYYNSDNDRNIHFVKLYLYWNIICIVRGFFVAADYWEWKFLIQFGMVLLLPLCIYIATNTYWVQRVLQQWFQYILPAFLGIYFVLMNEAVGHYLVPVSIILLFFPFLTKKWKIITVVCAVVVFAANLGARSNVIKFVIPMLLSLVYYFKVLANTKVLKVTRFLFMVLPFVLLYLGVTNTFNIFKMNEYIEGDYEAEQEQDIGGPADLTADTRTFLYVEVITSALKYDYMWLGRTPARGNESQWFGPGIDRDLGTNKMERPSNEVSILNVFTWTGVVGVVLYFLVFFKASYLALYKSKSRIMKIVGVYVAFRWTYAWVEDFSMFNLNYFFLWVMIAMCLSNDFRAMNDREFKNWVRGIFDKRYRAAILKKQWVKSAS